jgi:hypothetical protein
MEIVGYCDWATTEQNANFNWLDLHREVLQLAAEVGWIHSSYIPTRNNETAHHLARIGRTKDRTLGE